MIKLIKKPSITNSLEQFTIGDILYSAWGNTIYVKLEGDLFYRYVPKWGTKQFVSRLWVDPVYDI